MNIKKIIQLNVELNHTERIALEEAIKVLQQIKETMEKYDCDTLKCCGEYTHAFYYIIFHFYCQMGRLYHRNSS